MFLTVMTVAEALACLAPARRSAAVALPPCADRSKRSIARDKYR